MPEDAVQELRRLPSSELAQARSEVRVLVISGLGLNCEVETAEAFRLVGADSERVHLVDLLDGQSARQLTDYRIVTFVGGFAFGDHLGAGFVFANRIRWRLYDQLVEFIDKGGLALGICNGFQTMVRLGMVPGFDGDYRTPRATLAPNDRLGYWDCWVRLKTDPESPCVWTRSIDTIDLPTRHGEGKLLTESPARPTDRRAPLPASATPRDAFSASCPTRTPISIPSTIRSGLGDASRAICPKRAPAWRSSATASMPQQRRVEAAGGRRISVQSSCFSFSPYSSLISSYTG